MKLSLLRNRTGGRAKGERGQMLIIAALVLPVMLGFTGLALDVGMMMKHRTERQNVADAASVAGAQYMMYNMNNTGYQVSDTVAEACKYVANNGYGGGTCPGTVGNGAVVDVYVGALTIRGTNYNPVVKVTITKTDSTFFIKVLGIASKEIQAHAVGSATPRKVNYALVVLDPTKCDSFKTSSNITITGGGAIVNSDATTGGTCLGESAVQNGGSIITSQTCYDGSTPPQPITCTLDYNPRATWTIPNNSSASPTPTKAPPFPDPLTCGPPAGNQSAEYCPRPVPCPDTGTGCRWVSNTQCSNTPATPVNARCVPISTTACGNHSIPCPASQRSASGFGPGVANPNTTSLSGSGEVELEPGTYYGGLKVTSSSQIVRFKPGVYVLAGTETNGNGGGFDYQAGSLCGPRQPSDPVTSCPVATGVTIINMGNPYLAAGSGGSCGGVKLTGSGDLKFAAPTVAHSTNLTGYLNMLFWQADNCTAQFQYAGSSTGGSWTQTGIIYLPKAEMKVTGGGNFGSVQLIVGTFTQSGSQAIVIDFKRYINTDNQQWKLVE